MKWTALEKRLTWKWTQRRLAKTMLVSKDVTSADEQLYLISTIKKRKTTYFGHIIRRNNIHRLLLDGPLEGKRSRRRPRTEWMTNITERNGNAIRRPRDICSRSGAMEDHDSQPSQRRRHLMMMMSVNRHFFILRLTHGNPDILKWYVISIPSPSATSTTKMTSW